MQRHWPRARGNLHADRAHETVRALPSSALAKPCSPTPRLASSVALCSICAYILSKCAAACAYKRAPFRIFAHANTVHMLRLRIRGVPARTLNANMLTGPFPAGISSLTRLDDLYAPASGPMPSTGWCDSRCGAGRSPRTASAAAFPRPSPHSGRSQSCMHLGLAHRAKTNSRCDVFASSSLLSPGRLHKLRVCCRDLPGNQFEGQVPPSIVAMRILEL
jgi:hypothetical protein